jgi:hypothetical protein
MAIQYLSGVNVSGDVGIGVASAQKALDVGGEVLLRKHLFIGGHGENESTNSIEIGRNRTGNGICFFDMTTDNTTYTDYGFRLIRWSGVNAETELYHRGTGNFNIKGQEASNVTFSTSNSERMRIASNGNVGIGTTSPNTALEVDGAITTTTSDYVQGSTGSRLILETSGTGNTHSFIQAQNSGGSSNSEDLALQLYGGNVGIGTASPSDKLEVDGTGVFGTGSAYALKLKSSSGARGIEISDNNGVDRGGIDWSASDFVIRNASDANLFKINYSSKQTNLYGNLNVSVAPTAAWMNLINGNETAFRLTTYNNGTNNSSSAYAFKQGLYYNTTENAAVTFWRGGGSTGGFLTFTTNNGAERMRIDSSGNVGIGTTSPGYNLVVGDGTQNTESRFYFGDGSYTSASGYGLYMSRTFSYIRPVTDESQTLNIGALNSAWGTISNNASLHTFGKDSTEFMRINSSGNVGIGTTNPLEKLHVEGNLELQGNFTIGSTSGNYWQRIRTVDSALSTGNAFNFETRNGSGAYLQHMVIRNDGNVGIGTTSPDAKLDIGVNNIITLDDTGSSTGFIGLGSYNDGTKNRAQGASYYGFGIEVDRPNARMSMNSYDSNGIISTSNITLKNNGDVGIGTDSPSEKLHVNAGNAEIENSAASLVLNSTSIYGVSNSIISQRLGASSPPQGSLEWKTGQYGGGSKWSTGITSSPYTSSYINLPHNTTGGNFAINIKNNERLTIDDNGNVGIGDTSPSAKLDVNGAVRANAGSSGGYEINTGYGVHGMKSYYGTLYFTTSVYAGGVNGISYKSMSASAFYVNSDYRLKSNVTALENAIERVKKLNVCRFNWKDKLDEEKVDGFIAHEVAEVIPEAVTGDKDAVREDGTLDPQQIDQSKVVPLLTAALKEAIEKIEQLENRIQTLENN